MRVPLDEHIRKSTITQTDEVKRSGLAYAAIYARGAFSIHSQTDEVKRSGLAYAAIYARGAISIQTQTDEVERILHHFARRRQGEISAANFLKKVLFVT